MPDYPPALTGRARVALSRGDARRAIEYLEKARRINPLPETAWLMGDARTMLGDAAGAQEEYNRVIREGRTSDRLTLSLFYATKDREPDEALRIIEAERAVRAGIYIDDTYAWALYRVGQFAAAREATDRALRLGTRDARLLFHAGAIRLAIGDSTGRQLIREAVRLNPKFDLTGAAEAAWMLGRGATSSTN
jgi:tetratricopeptide (TPR) repeat protein